MPAFNMQYLRAKAPIVSQVIAEISNEANNTPLKKLNRDIAIGINIPQATVPIQKTGAILPRVNAITAYLLPVPV